MDEFSGFGNSFDHYLHNLTLAFSVLEILILYLFWKSFILWYKKCIVLGCIMSSTWVELDRAIVAIEELLLLKMKRPSKVYFVMPVSTYGIFTIFLRFLNH